MASPSHLDIPWPPLGRCWLSYQDQTNGRVACRGGSTGWMTFRSSTINSAFNQSINQSPPARVGNSCKPPSRLFPRRLPRRPVVSERGPNCGLHGGGGGGHIGWADGRAGEDQKGGRRQLPLSIVARPLTSGSIRADETRKGREGDRRESLPWHRAKHRVSSAFECASVHGCLLFAVAGWLAVTWGEKRGEGANLGSHRAGRKRTNGRTNERLSRRGVLGGVGILHSHCSGATAAAAPRSVTGERACSNVFVRLLGFRACIPMFLGRVSGVRSASCLCICLSVYPSVWHLTYKYIYIHLPPS